MRIIVLHNWMGTSYHCTYIVGVRTGVNTEHSVIVVGVIISCGVVHPMEPAMMRETCV